MDTILLGLYEKSMPNTLTWEEKLLCTKECGFHYLEMSIDETDEKLERLNMNKQDRIKLVDLMFKHEIKIGSICLSGHRKYPLGSKDGNVRARSMEIMEKAVILASDLGIPIIQLAGYDVYYEQGDAETKRMFIENLKKSTEIAGKYGVILAFETMETPFMDTVEKAMEYVRLIDSPYLKIYPDCGNVTNATKLYKTDPVTDFKKGKGHLAAVHLKETVSGKYREIPFGTGHVSFEEIIKISYELGVRRFTAEFWYTNQENWKDVIREANAFIGDKFQILDKC